jgi:DNA-binding MarR family transcriptional regulator
MSMTPVTYPLRNYGLVLATRELGADVAEHLRANTLKSGGVIVDFCDIRVASSPFLDELACVLRAMIADTPRRFVLLANLNEDLADTLELVLQRRDIVLTVVRDGKLETVGGTRQLDETLAEADVLGTFTAADLAERLELKLPNLHQRLAQLTAAGALVRSEDPSAKRGRRLLFQTPGLDYRVPAGSC